MKSWYNPAQKKTTQKSRINLTSLLSWLTVFAVIVIFWSAVTVGYKRDYVSRSIAKIEHKEKKFLATHKALQKKMSGSHTLI